MNDKDTPLDRMRAADPAIGSHPNLAHLHEKVGAGLSEETDRAVRVREGRGRRSRVPMIAAAAALAMGVGVGGYALGAGTATPDPDSEAGQGLTRTSDPDVGRPFGADRPDGMPGDGTSDGMPMGESDMEILSGGGSGGAIMGGYGESSWYDGSGYAVVLYPGEGLSTSGGSGEVLQPVVSDADADAMLRDWAERLGVTGEFESWEDGYASLYADSVYLNVNTGSYSSLDYSNERLQYWCDYGEEEYSTLDSAEATAAPMPEPMEPECTEPDLEPIDDATALATVEQFLTDAGLDPSAYELRVVYNEDKSVEIAAVNQTGTVPVTGHFSVTSEGVSYGSVQLPRDYTSLGDYPTVSEVEAVERLNDPRFVSNWYVSLPGIDDYFGGYGYDYDWDMWVEPDPIVLSPGDAIPYPVSEATITEATLTTGLLALADGTEIAVPVYDLRDAEGNSYPMIALADEALDFTD